MSIKKQLLLTVFGIGLFLINPGRALAAEYWVCQYNGVWGCFDKSVQPYQNSCKLYNFGTSYSIKQQCETSPEYKQATAPAPTTEMWYACLLSPSTVTCKKTKDDSCATKTYTSLSSCQKDVSYTGYKYVNESTPAPSTESWYACLLTSKTATCSKTKSSSCASTVFTSQSECKSYVLAAGNEYVEEATGNKVVGDDKKAANVHCDCSAVSPDLECKDGFKTMQEAVDACNSCSPGSNYQLKPGEQLVPFGNGPCPLGTKKSGTFSCTCGKGTKSSCTPFYTFKELDAFCPSTCTRANSDCEVVLGDSLYNLQKKAASLNKVGFSLGTSGVLEIIGKLINFLLYPIGMFTMVLYIWAGFLWMSAQGNADNVSKAKSIIVWTTLGVVITLASYMIVKFVFSELL